ncbi:DNRLRE domain-containing protein [Streptomyces sp. NPDC090082]|uniref:DNRLRE domain-containing protein n=1 Tax=unclassified Streptomyces TaxID=2593676 RepID=UPI00381735BA
MTSRGRQVSRRPVLAVAAATAVLAAGFAATGLGDPRPDSRPARAQEHAPPRTASLDEADAATAALAYGKAVEATALRTAYSTTWARPDGMLQRRIHASPVRAKVGGEWKPIDTTLARVASGWSPRATNTRMVFSPGSRSSSARSSRDGVERSTLTGADRASRAGGGRISLLPMVALPENSLAVIETQEEDWMVLTWPGPIPKPVVDGSRLLYQEILPGADLVITADDNGFAQVLVVKNRQAAADPRVAQLAYGLWSTRLDFRLDSVSGVLNATRDGRDVIESSTPFMWDSSGTATLTDGPGGSGATPPEPEVLPTDDDPSPDPTDMPTDTEPADPGPTEPVDNGDQGDVLDEVLPDAPEGTADPSWTSAPLPPVPAEPTPEPTRTGAEATLSLAPLNGPQPDSRGALVGTDLEGENWVLTPDQNFLSDPSTVYPVFIDPSVKQHTNDWTTAYSRHKDASFYNGKNFNKGGTHEARVGFESDTWGTSRSFFSIDWDSDLQDAVVQRAKLRALETYSWSCNARTMTVHVTGTISSKTNWRNMPVMNNANKIGGASFAHGWKSANCPDDYAVFDITPTAQKAVSGGWRTLTLGFRAGDENSQYAWKKFQADGDSGPYVDLVYNRPPAPPTGLDLDPDLSCDTTAPYINVSASSLTFWGNASDKDGNLASLVFDLWPSGGSTTNLLGAKGTVSVGSQTKSARVHTDPVPTGNVTGGLKLVSGKTYSWRARAVDKAGKSSDYSHKTTPCRFVFDTSRPTPPTVGSSQFPDADANDNGFNNEPEDMKWSTVKFGTAGSFTFRASQTDVVKFEYGFNQASYPFSVARTAGSPVTTPTTVSNVKPPLAGPNVLYARAVDGAGNRSEPRKYFFYVTPRDKADQPGDFTGDALADLMVVDAGGNLRLYPSEATTDLLKGTGDLDYSMSGAYRGNPDKDPTRNDGKPVFIGAPSGYWKKTQIAHLGDVYGGDGLQDLVAVREGRMWVYPGDGYGAVNVDRRQEILLPSNAPAPATITQLVSAGDATGDGRTDFFVKVGDALWALVGYNGATVERAVLVSSSGWLDQDLVTVQDIGGDAVTDLVYRQHSTGRLLLRTGKKAASGTGVDLASLGATTAETVYGSGGWSRTSIRMVYGTPDATGDGVPDVWTVRTDGAVRFYAGAPGVLPGAGTEIVSATGGGWKGVLTIG